jgi:hypothetical protein
MFNFFGGTNEKIYKEKKTSSKMGMLPHAQYVQLMKLL